MMNNRLIMTPYPEYKATNLPWLPQIPAHWDIVPLAACAKEKSITNQSDLELLSVYLDRGVIRFSQEAAKRTNVTSEDLSKYQRVDVGDLVLNNQQAWRGSVGVSSFTGIVSPAYIVLKLSDRLYSKFANYLFRDNLMVAHYVTASKGIGSIQRNLYWVNLKRKNLFLPPIDEQEQIVRYLDSMTAKINKLIRAKKKQIALLQEQKQAIINQAVTKGLNPDAEMKDSGIDWLGQIPAHWETSRCKYLLKEVNIRSENGEEEHLSMSQKDGLIPDSKLDGHHLMSESYAGGKICKKDDLVLNRLKAHLGVFALAPQLGVVSPHYRTLNINNRKVLPRYIEHVLKSNSCRSELRIRVRGIVEGFWRLYTDDLYDITLPLPSIEEQQQILNFIVQKIRGIDKCLSDYMNNIDLLKEYLNSLIASVVTGQVDVRNIPVEEFDPADLAPETDDDPAEEESTEESEE